jgi:hypothetical protein
MSRKKLYYTLHLLFPTRADLCLSALVDKNLFFPHAFVKMACDIFLLSLPPYIMDNHDLQGADFAHTKKGLLP